MDVAPVKRGRGRPRKNPAPPPSETRPDPVPADLDIELEPDSSDASAAELEAELKRAMDSPDPMEVVRDCPVDDYTRLIDDPPVTKPETNVVKTPAKPIKKMTSTTRKLMKFGYSQVLRAADPLTKGRIPGEKMAYILANDEAADALLDEILNDLDAKYKVEQYMNPESKILLFTAQLFMQARAMPDQGSSSSRD